MISMLTTFSRLVTARPYLTILLLLVVTVALAMGAQYRATPPDTRAQLPENSVVVQALDEIDEYFADSGAARVTTILFRGDAFTPNGLSQTEALVGSVAADPAIAPLLTDDDPVVSPAALVKALLQVDSFDSVTPAMIESAQGPPHLKAALDALTGTDAADTQITVATLRLRDTGDDRIADAERTIHRLAVEDQGPLRASTISFIIVEDEYKKATEEGLAPFVLLSLVLIAGLLLLFLRTLSDLLLTLAGLLISIIWIVGAEGWLGPNALGLVGPPNSLTTMVPIIVISLTVDYAIQTISHYRERRAAGDSVLTAVRTGMCNVTVPLILAAVTTMVSLLSNLYSPIGIVGDFGIVAAMGVGLSFIVMLTLIPAGRTIIDRRREAHGTLRPPRPIANALPGVERAAELLGRRITRAPAPYIIAVLAVTAALGFAATGLKSEFKIHDILPRGGSVLADMNTLDAAVGGSTELTTALVKAEATEARTLLNVRDLTDAFADPARRPNAAAGPIIASYEMSLRDWTTDSGEPGDRYDPEIADLFRRASAGLQLDPVLMQEVLDRLKAKDPYVAHLMIDDPNGVDLMLLQFPSYANPAQTKSLQPDIEDRWFGEDDAVTATSASIISVTVTDAITEHQSEAISVTIAAAIIVLAIFFWFSARQPALAVIAVGPIVLVLISVLGTMALLGIPYTIITSMITALSIGIGVDYTIHVIHRYREEFTRSRDPERAAVRTLATTGSALLGSALTTAIGIGVLAASPIAASQQFGFTAAITIGYSLLAAILVVPPAMTVWGAYQNMRLRSMVQRVWDDLDVAIDDIHQRREREQPDTP